MKLKDVDTAKFDVDVTDIRFVLQFQAHLLKELKKRGILNVTQYEKSISVLKARAK